MTGLEFTQKLAALVPRPNLIRYHGVLAPNAKWRSQIVQQATADPVSAHAGADPPIPIAPKQSISRLALAHPCASQHLDILVQWARLLKRVFNIDMDRCPNCQGRLTVFAAWIVSATEKLLGIAIKPVRLQPMREVDVAELSVESGLLGDIDIETMAKVAKSEDPDLTSDGSVEISAAPEDTVQIGVRSPANWTASLSRDGYVGWLADESGTFAAQFCDAICLSHRLSSYLPEPDARTTTRLVVCYRIGSVGRDRSRRAQRVLRDGGFFWLR